MNRARALELLHTHLSENSLRSHCLASEAVMRAMARAFGEDEDTWGLAGLLHDLDFEITRDDMHRHGLETSKILAEEGLSPEICRAIEAHNGVNTGVEPCTRMETSLICAETITGLVVACALVLPDKSLASLKPSSVVKRMKKKEFARSVNRDDIRRCEEVGLPLEQFAALAVGAMQDIAADIGL